MTMQYEESLSQDLSAYMESNADDKTLLLMDYGTIEPLPKKRKAAGAHPTTITGTKRACAFCRELHKQCDEGMHITPFNDLALGFFFCSVRVVVLLPDADAVSLLWLSFIDSLGYELYFRFRRATLQQT
jgi:hypothetical protein